MEQYRPTNCLYYPKGLNNGTSNNPIIFTNWGFWCISNSGATECTLEFKGGQWFKLSGFNSTNAYRCPFIQFCTNYEVSYCTSGGTNSLGVLASWDNYNYDEYFHDHHNFFGFSQPHANTNCADGSVHGATFGLFQQGGPDGTAYGIIESNTFGWSGHDCISFYGANSVIQYNWCVGVPWANWMYTNADCLPLTVGDSVISVPMYCGSRVIDVGGTWGTNNLIQSNTVTGGGADPDLPGAITIDNGGQEIVRFNTIVGAAGNSIQVYGKGNTGYNIAGSNYIYNNSSMFSGFGTFFVVSTQDPTNISDSAWQNSYAFASTSNNFLLNNLDYWSYTDSWRFTDGYSTDIKWMANNMTNTNPNWANTNYPLDTLTLDPNETPPDFHLESGSPALAAGTWIGYITSATGSGTSFVATNAAAFWAGTTAAWRTIPGDTIELYYNPDGGQILGEEETVITSIVGNTISVNSSVDWTNITGIAVAFEGIAPNVGAY